MPKLEIASLGFDHIGRAAVLVTLAIGTPFEEAFTRAATAGGLQLVKGRVGSMELAKVVAAIETTAHRGGLFPDEYRSEHALYHATIEALHGVCRGQLTLGSLLRTAGLVFTVARGHQSGQSGNGLDWVAVCLYGSIGSPRVGWEHETIGLGINHL